MKLSTPSVLLGVSKACAHILVIVGKISLCSPDHVSLLVHRTFNVSIPRQHLPTDNWEFEYGPAENDPEFGPEVAEEDSNEGVKKDVTDDVNDAVDGGGRWIHKVTADRLGGADGYLEFTVVGYVTILVIFLHVHSRLTALQSRIRCCR